MTHSVTAWDEAMARVAYFIAITPPAEHCARIQQALTEVGIVSPFTPHVTVKSQPGLADPATWLDAVEAVVAEAPSFEMALGGPKWFGSDIVYLSVDQTHVVHVHHRILGALATAGISEFFEYDGPGYIPHLTLAATFAGHTPEQLASIASNSAGWRSDPFQVEKVSVFRRADWDEPYAAWRNLPLQPRDPTRQP
jgi:2'-5' RNA ligase